MVSHHRGSEKSFAGSEPAMGKHGQFATHLRPKQEVCRIMGPAGSGKSTYCQYMHWPGLFESQTNPFGAFERLETFANTVLPHSKEFSKGQHEHLKVSRRKCNVVNLDPAAEVFNYPVSIDITQLELLSAPGVPERHFSAFEYLQCHSAIINNRWVIREHRGSPTAKSIPFLDPLPGV